MTERLPEVASKASTTSIAVLEATADALAEKQRELDKARATIAQMEALLRDGLLWQPNAAWFNDWQKDVREAFPHLADPKSMAGDPVKHCPTCRCV